MLILNSKAKRKDFSAAREMISHFINNKDKRIADLKTQLNEIGFNNNADEQAEKLYEQEKSLIKEFVSLYLQHDSARLLKYPRNIINVDNEFLKISGTAGDNTAPAEPIKDTSEESANATILAREQAESNDEQLKELSELRLKNTELNEHLFEALETITELMTEHGKKTGQEIDTNSQKVLEAIIYLRDKRLGKEQEPTSIETPEAPKAQQEPDDATLDESTTVNLGLNEDVEADLDAITDTEEEDPWAEALSEQAAAEADQQTDEIEIEIEIESDLSEDDNDDPWADALAEQATAEAENEAQTSTEEEDPWADALAEQAAAEVEEDPWAKALAEQNEAENKS